MHRRVWDIAAALVDSLLICALMLTCQRHAVAGDTAG